MDKFILDIDKPFDLSTVKDDSPPLNLYQNSIFSFYRLYEYIDYDDLDPSVVNFCSWMVEKNTGCICGVDIIYDEQYPVLNSLKDLKKACRIVIWYKTRIGGLIIKPYKLCKHHLKYYIKQYRRRRQLKRYQY